MIIARTPFRISFFGGGTDYKEFYLNNNGGSVLSTTIDKYTYVSVRKLPKYFNYKNQVIYSKIESTNTVDEICHPSVRETLKYMNLKDMRISYDTDLPARAGLGSSSSFTVGMLNAFHTLKNEIKGKRELAEEAIYIERELCSEAGGIQDQIAVSYGGFNRINFDKSGFNVIPINIEYQRKKYLNENLMLFFTGFSRYSFEYAIEYKSNIKEKNNNLIEMRKLVDEAENILYSNTDLNEFGKLLNYSWQLKRGISSVISTDFIDNIYKIGIKNGALGGKILGAGGGGFILFYIEKCFQKKLREELKKLKCISIKFEDIGTDIIYSL